MSGIVVMPNIYWNSRILTKTLTPWLCQIIIWYCTWIITGTNYSWLILKLWVLRKCDVWERSEWSVQGRCSIYYFHFQLSRRLLMGIIYNEALCIVVWRVHAAGCVCVWKGQATLTLDALKVLWVHHNKKYIFIICVLAFGHFRKQFILFSSASAHWSIFI